jgi:hypothetical protein
MKKPSEAQIMNFVYAAIEADFIHNDTDNVQVVQWLIDQVKTSIANKQLKQIEKTAATENKRIADKKGALDFLFNTVDLSTNDLLTDIARSSGVNLAANQKVGA